MTSFAIEQLTAFIVRAKAASDVGSGAPSSAGRPGSHDLQFSDDAFAYLDSYFGGSDFIGEEVIYYEERPVWAMNYYGHIIEPNLITAAETGRIIKASLSQMYLQDRFLGGFEHTLADDTYVDTNTGDVRSFTGIEWIKRRNRKVYELVYHGGLILD